MCVLMCGCASGSMSLCISFKLDSSSFMGIPVDEFRTCCELLLTLSQTTLVFTDLTLKRANSGMKARE